MRSSAENSPIHFLDMETIPTFNVVIAYEDFESSKTAKKTYDYLTENLGAAYYLSNKLWKFEVLEHPQLRELASRDAATADIVMVASHGSDPLPEGVKAWIHSWPEGKSNALALVALFDAETDRPENAKATRDYLQQVAQRNQMEFFAQPAEVVARTGSPSVIRRFFGASTVPQGATVTAISSIVQHDAGANCPRWGINE
jgi:hypothetical protein